MTRAVIPDKGDVISEVCRAVPWVDVLRLVDIINAIIVLTILIIVIIFIIIIMMGMPTSMLKSS